MKKFIQIAIAAILVVGVLAFPGSYHFAFAQAGGGFASSIQVQNLGLTDASIQITYYNQDGTLATMPAGVSNPVNDTVKLGQSNTYYPVHAAAGFNGSVVISSGQPIAAVSNLVVNTAAQGVDSYVGVQSGGSPIFYPLVMKGNASQTSMLTVQNTGTADPATVTLKFTPEVGSAYAAIPDVTLSVRPGAAQTYNLGSGAQFSAIAKWVGSVTATASAGTIAGVSTTVNVKFAAANQLNTYNAFSKGSPTVALPLIQENNSGNRTSVNCQNIGTATTTITVTYTPETGSVAKQPDSKASVPQNGAAVFLQDYTGTAKFVGSALVSSNPPSNLVCVVNQQKPAFGRASSYTGFDPATATGKVVLPLIQSRNGRDTTTGWVYTSINLATSDGASHPVKCDFNPAPGFNTPTAATGSGASVIFVQNNIFGDGTKFLGGATCTVTDASGAGLFAIVNQTREASPQNPRDVLASYDGFNQ
jgi:hypothetical protein